MGLLDKIWRLERHSGYFDVVLDQSNFGIFDIYWSALNLVKLSRIIILYFLKDFISYFSFWFWVYFCFLKRYFWMHVSLVPFSQGAPKNKIKISQLSLYISSFGTVRLVRKIGQDSVKLTRQWLRYLEMSRENSLIRNGSSVAISNTQRFRIVIQTILNMNIVGEKGRTLSSIRKTF